MYQACYSSYKVTLFSHENKSDASEGFICKMSKWINLFLCKQTKNTLLSK